MNAAQERILRRAIEQRARAAGAILITEAPKGRLVQHWDSVGNMAVGAPFTIEAIYPARQRPYLIVELTREGAPRRQERATGYTTLSWVKLVP